MQNVEQLTSEFWLEKLKEYYRDLDDYDSQALWITINEYTNNPIWWKGIAALLRGFASDIKHS